MSHKECINCSSTNILNNIRMIDKSDYRTMDMEFEFEKDNRSIFGKKRGKMISDICKDCGHIMFKVKHVNILKDIAN